MLIVTGMSGAGRSTVGNALEDLGWYVVDNLPPQMLRPLVDLAEHAGDAIPPRIAAVVDVRGRRLLRRRCRTMRPGAARRRDVRVRVPRCHRRRARAPLRVGAPPASAPGRRHAARRHPRRARRVSPSCASRATSSSTRPTSTSTSSRRSSRDRSPRRGRAGLQRHAAELRLQVRAARRRRPRRRHALPAEPVLDPRAAAPHRRGRRGRRDYVLGQPGAREFIDALRHARSSPVLAGYQRENKRHATIAVGCTGGKHRSVAMAAELADRLGATPRRRRERQAPRPRPRMIRPNEHDDMRRTMRGTDR